MYAQIAPTRELRRRACAEVRTARALEPLESAGWVAFHDRLVAHERVPHILLGPPGAVVGHPHSFGGCPRGGPAPAGFPA
ncbi:MAG: NERD domain-containing protein, partial [Dermatophilaceae bacterium]|nr:NERD domain-containing protein [Dermatophilaceae bacterium]